MRARELAKLHPPSLREVSVTIGDIVSDDLILVVLTRKLYPCRVGSIKPTQQTCTHRNKLTCTISISGQLRQISSSKEISPSSLFTEAPQRCTSEISPSSLFTEALCHDRKGPRALCYRDVPHRCTPQMYPTDSPELFVYRGTTSRSEGT